jgi:hypothetical protein
VFITGLPSKILKNDLGQLHSTEEAAAQWPDGEGYYFIDGIGFPEQLWRRIHDKTLTSDEAIKIENLDQRTAAIRQLGWDVMLNSLKAKEIHVMKEKISSDSKWAWAQGFGKESINYTLYECDLHDDEKPARLLKLEWFTGDKMLKTNILRVRPDIDTCEAALAYIECRDQGEKLAIRT